MSRKTSQARREAFFAALSETGNQTISAERARVSRSWVALHRANDPAFRARMEEAIARARASLAASARGDTKPSAKWRSIDGEALVVRGSGGSGGGRRTQLARARVRQWTAHEERRFCDVLAQTCNVKLACKAAGLSPVSAYAHRHRNRDFADAWDAALEDGFLALETGLLENALRTLGPLVGDADPDQEPGDWKPALPMEPISFDDAVRLLGLHRAGRTGMGKRAGRVPGRMPQEAIEAALLKRLKALYAKKVAARRRAERLGLPVPEDNIGVFFPGQPIPPLSEL